MKEREENYIMPTRYSRRKQTTQEMTMNSRKVKSNYGFGRQFEMACLGLARHGRQAALSATLLSILSVASISFGAQPIAGKIEAESFVAQSGIQTQPTSDVGGGLNVGWVDAGDWMDYSVDVTVAGGYTVEWRLAGSPGGGVIQLRQNGTPMSSLTSPNTGDWQTYQTVSNTVTFSQTGVQTLRVYAVSGGWNFNWMNFVKTADPVIVNNAQTATSVSTSQATLNGALAMAFDTNTTSVTVYWGTTDGGTTAGNWTGGTNTWAAPQSVGVPLAYVASGFATNTAYFFRFYAADATTNDWADATATWITAPVTLSTISNASEAGLVPGVFRVTRPSSVTAGALVVNYTVSGGDAVAGQNYVELSGSVTILAGQTSADISVEPIADWKSEDDKTLSISLIETDSYLVDSGSSSSQITIQNFTIPYSYPTNVWVSTDSTDASLAENWSLGVPQSTHDILLGVYSTVDMTWDVDGVNGLTDTVASWTQTDSYANTVTMATVYPVTGPGSFTNMTVTGDVTISGGGFVGQHNEGTDEDYRIFMTIGGDLTVDDGLSISVKSCGYRNKRGPGAGGHSGPSWDHQGGGHGGIGGPGGGDAYYLTSETYGSVLHPISMGSGGYYDQDLYSGGGAIHFAVAGKSTINGSLDADGVQLDTDSAGGAGGSIYLTTGEIDGTGLITANGSSVGSSRGGGGGGRIAIIANTGSVTGLTIRATGGKSGTNPRDGAAGTIYTKLGADKKVMIENFADASTFGNTAFTPAYVATDIRPTYTNVYSGTSFAYTDNLDSVSVELGTAAEIDLQDDQKFSSLNMTASDAVLRLNNKTLTLLTLNGLTIMGTTYTVGTYTAADLPQVTDAVGAGTGVVIVRAIGTLLILQ
jgi:hypothetical protein